MQNTAKATIIKIMRPIIPIKLSSVVTHQHLPLSIAGLGLFLLAITLPSFGSRIIQLNYADLRQPEMNYSATSTKDLELFLRAYKKALLWHKTSTIMDNLAQAELQRSVADSQNINLAKKEFEEASLWQARSLGEAPANSYGWARFAYMQIQIRGISPLAATALQYSLQTGPYEPSLALSRLSMAMMLFNFLDEHTQNKIPSLIRLAWKEKPEQLARMAKKESFVSMAEQALRSDSESLENFRNLLTSEQKATDENDRQ